MNHLIISFFLVSFASSCFSKPKQNYFRLQIAVDTSANFYINKITLLPPNKFSSAIVKATIKPSPNTLYYFDSVSSGPAEFTIRSLFDRTYMQNIVINSDTTIYVKKAQLNNYEKDKRGALFDMFFSSLDTFHLAMTSWGCFHHYVEKTAIEKDGNAYQVRFTSDDKEKTGVSVEKKFGLEFSKFLDSLQSQWKRRKLGSDGGSTTSCEFYINIGNKVFVTPYSAGKEFNWSVYYNFTQHFDSSAKQELAYNEEYKKMMESFRKRILMNKSYR